MGTSAFHHRDGLHVHRLGEHVEGTDGDQAVAVPGQYPRVAGQGRGIAGDVDDPRRPEGVDRLQDRTVAAVSITKIGRASCRERV